MGGFPGGAMSVTCEGFTFSPRIQDPLELASSQSLFTGCPALLGPGFCGAALPPPPTRRAGVVHSRPVPCVCPLRDTPRLDGVLLGNNWSAHHPFMTETPQEHSPRVLFAVVACLQIFPPGSWHRSSVALPMSWKGKEDHGIK